MQYQCAPCRRIVTAAEANMGQAVACGHCGRFSMAPPSRLAPGAVLDTDFVIVKRRAHGGMGTIYLAQQLSMNRPVALKILLGRYSHDPASLSDFLREGRTTARLKHPAMITAYAAGEDDGICFFAMEYTVSP